MRFKKGDLARYVVPLGTRGIASVGAVVEILAVGARVCEDPYTGKVEKWGDYTITDPRGITAFRVCADYQLAPLDPPAEPASLTRREELEEQA